MARFQDIGQTFELSSGELLIANFDWFLDRQSLPPVRSSARRSSYFSSAIRRRRPSASTVIPVRSTGCTAYSSRDPSSSGLSV